MINGSSLTRYPTRPVPPTWAVMAPPGSDSRTPYISGDPLMYSKRGSTSLRLLLGAILMSLLACDIPTGVPRWNTDWALPVEALELSVESLLPRSEEHTSELQSR